MGQWMGRLTGFDGRPQMMRLLAGRLTAEGLASVMAAVVSTAAGWPEAHQ